METKEKKVEFYGGAVGVWTPVIVMLIGMIINTVLAGGLTTLPMVTFLAMAVGFLLAKDKKTFGSVTLKGLQNPMFGTEAVAFIFAGILAQLLRQSGLIQALIYVVAQLELNTGLLRHRGGQLGCHRRLLAEPPPGPPHRYHRSGAQRRAGSLPLDGAAGIRGDVSCPGSGRLPLCGAGPRRRPAGHGAGVLHAGEQRAGKHLSHR